MGVQGVKDRARGYGEVVEAHNGRLPKQPDGDILGVHLAEALWLEKGGDSYIACTHSMLSIFAISCTYSIDLYSSY